MIIEFSENNYLSEKEQADRLEELFKDCIPLFDPYWAAIINGENTMKPQNNDIPLNKFVHWLNYWGSDLVDEIGEDRMKVAPVFSMTEWHDGYLIKLQENPIDNENPVELEAQRAAKEYFGL